jgi:hypothetical protein
MTHESREDLVLAIFVALAVAGWIGTVVVVWTGIASL